MDLGDYNPLDEKWRWCIHCNADCWPEPENQQHAADCPISTGLYVVSDRDEDPWSQGTYGGCCSCDTMFQLGDHYVFIDAKTGKPATSPEYGEVTCTGCAALASAA